METTISYQGIYTGIIPVWQLTSLRFKGLGFKGLGFRDLSTLKGVDHVGFKVQG